MATYTTNYNLKKPASSDTVDVADINGNMDAIDTAMKSLGALEFIKTYSQNISIPANGISSQQSIILQNQTTIESGYNYIGLMRTGNTSSTGIMTYGGVEITSNAARPYFYCINSTSSAVTANIKTDLFRFKTTDTKAYFYLIPTPTYRAYEMLMNGIAVKQDALTFDTTPTANSTNPVTSGGVKAALDGMREIVSNTTVSTWASDNTYPDYGYRASIAITGVTASDVAEVVFGLTEATSGDYAPVCETYAGGVYIYSKVNDSITIPTIIVNKG